MPDPEKVIIVVGEWVVKAENDLKNAAHSLELEQNCPTDTVCFHAQQIIEKYLKSLLTLRGIPFPKTHSIKELINLLPARIRPNLSKDDQDKLTDYATGARYPGWGEIPLTEARQAVQLARRVRKEIRRFLPNELLSKKER